MRRAWEPCILGHPGPGIPLEISRLRAQIDRERKLFQGTGMRIDKLTTKFQQALADAQSQALAHDNGFIEPQHLLSALLAQEDGGTVSLLQRAGANVGALRKA